jgi:hypothetical protein
MPAVQAPGALSGVGISLSIPGAALSIREMETFEVPRLGGSGKRERVTGSGSRPACQRQPGRFFDANQCSVSPPGSRAKN